MKTGKTLAELAAEIARQNDSKKDYIVETRALALVPTTEAARPIEAQMEGGRYGFGVTGTGHRQIAEHVSIPAKYYDRMREHAPALLCQNVNHWLANEPAKRMVRTLDGNLRALLSDKYRPLENYDLAQVALPIMAEKALEVISCEITETRLYIKAVDSRVVRTINTQRVVDGRMVTADDVCPSVTLSNSEIGMGALSLEVGMYTHKCKNMAIFTEGSMKRYHVGARIDVGNDALREVFSDRTRRVTDAALYSQLGDVMRAAFDADVFSKRVEAVQAMTADRITSTNIPKVVEVVARAFNLSETTKGNVLTQLIAGADLSRYGLFNAVTRAAEDADGYDAATDLERLGGRIIELPANDWKRIAEAA